MFKLINFDSYRTDKRNKKNMKDQRSIIPTYINIIL